MNIKKIKKVFLLSIILGFIAWLLWTPATGMEPWDDGMEWFLALFCLLGMVCGWVSGQKPWLWALGIFSGPALLSLPNLWQELFRGKDEDWLGFGYTFLWATIAILGYIFLSAFLGSFVGIKAKELWVKIKYDL